MSANYKYGKSRATITTLLLLGNDGNVLALIYPLGIIRTLFFATQLLVELDGPINKGNTLNWITAQKRAATNNSKARLGVVK
jgi:hypothetical protein